MNEASMINSIKTPNGLSLLIDPLKLRVLVSRFKGKENEKSLLEYVDAYAYLQENLTVILFFASLATNIDFLTLFTYFIICYFLGFLISITNFPIFKWIIHLSKKYYSDGGYFHNLSYLLIFIISIYQFSYAYFLIYFPIRYIIGVHLFDKLMYLYIKNLKPKTLENLKKISPNFWSKETLFLSYSYELLAKKHNASLSFDITKDEEDWVKSDYRFNKEDISYNYKLKY